MGAYLRAARRKRRIGMDRAAEDTRIRADFLMRMESDEFDFLAPTYVRGFLKTYARYLRVNPDPLMIEFDSRYGSQRVDTAQIVALERHGKRHMAANRKKLSSWAVAAIGATAVIIALFAIGLAQGEDDPKEDRVAVTSDSSPEPSDEPQDPTPSPSPSPSETLATADGIELEIIAANADCWILVTEDGKEATPSAGIVIPLGESMKFSATDAMFVRLGFPAGVELVVNGQNIGSPGGQNPIDLRLPEDIDAL
jgi:cytoskeleton protein RodZ